MSRFYDIWHLLTFAGLAIGFVNGLGVWGLDYMTAPESSTFELSDIESMTGGGDISAWDQFTLLVSQAVTAFGMIAQMALSVVLVYPTMVDVFHMPPIVATLVQGGVVLSWVSFFMQILLRFGFKQVES
ncbi:MAG TPA: hypothetical protein GX530_09040 [Corynebacteriales bacterium]|nr:hypothetical protein [Mycobacteriales bacterium]